MSEALLTAACVCLAAAVLYTVAREYRLERRIAWLEAQVRDLNAAAYEHDVWRDEHVEAYHGRDA